MIKKKILEEIKAYVVFYEETIERVYGKPISRSTFELLAQQDIPELERVLSNVKRQAFISTDPAINKPKAKSI